MGAIEQLVINLLLNFISAESINTFLGDPRTVAMLVGGLVAISGALLGTFLLLRKMSLTSDAISHTILLGIVVAFMVMVGVFGMEPDLSSPWLIIGAAAAGVATVVLTELIFRSGLVKQDAALGLAFPLLFAISVILISRFIDNVHLDADSVIVGEIGLAWANTNSHCSGNCDEVIITPDHPRAEVGRTCTNCTTGGINPRSPQAVFEETCSNCGTYTAGEAWQNRLIDEAPALVFWPKSLTVMGLITILNLLFVTVFYKELKLSTFDSALAKALGFRPAYLHYGLMILVSVTAVGAFDAVGAILVIAFFIIPPATAYLLTNRLSLMLILSPIFGALAAFTGYDLARGNFLGLVDISDVLTWLDKVVGLGGYTEWNVSISASMVIMAFVFFVLAWVLSPRQGLVSSVIRRRRQQQQFAAQVLLGHIYNHQGSAVAQTELAVETLHQHFRWSPARMQWAIARLRALNLVRVQEDQIALTERGEKQVRDFRQENLAIS
ncbi:MAG: metal ABC transporter permease [Chitinophagaceae bacterium]|nr:metal ABC transporter permease [Anaerolineae bacterium]